MLSIDNEKTISHQMNYNAWKLYFNFFIKLSSSEKDSIDIIVDMSNLLLNAEVKAETTLEHTSYLEYKKLVEELTVQRIERAKQIREEKNKTRIM